MTDPTKKLYTNQDKIPVKDPRVFRVELEGPNHYSDFLRLRKNIFKRITGTYGYSNIYDSVSDMGQTSPFQASIIKISKSVYFFFEDDQDSMQFKLSIDRPTKEVEIWPSSLRFTVHIFEY